MKTCTICKILKPLEGFAEGRNQCRICRNEKKKTYTTRRGMGLKEYRLFRTYKMTLDDYNEKLNSQNGVCAICKKLDDGYWKTLAVDHCHKTGKVRALLCHKCNKGLGQFKDDPDLLRTAAEYLKTFAK